MLRVRVDQREMPVRQPLQPVHRPHELAPKKQTARADDHNFGRTHNADHPARPTPRLRRVIPKQISAQMTRNFTPPPGAERRLIYRISGAARPDPGLPLAVRSTGHYRVPACWIERSDPKWFLELFWTARGGGTYRLGRHTFQARPGDIFIYDGTYTEPNVTENNDMYSSKKIYCGFSASC